MVLQSRLYIDEEFPGGGIDRSMLIDHVAYRLWQGEVYILCLTLIFLLLFYDVLKSNLDFFLTFFFTGPSPVEGDIPKVKDE